MSIDPLNLIPDIVTRGPGIIGPHNRSWGAQHGQPHGGEGPRGFPPAMPRGDSDIGRGVPGFGGGDRGGAGIERPSNGNNGNGGIDRPGPGGPGQGSGQGPSLGNTVTDALGLPRQVFNLPASHPHGHVPGHAVAQHAQLAAPSQGWAQPQAVHGAPVAAPQVAPMMQAPGPHAAMPQAMAQPALASPTALASQPAQMAQPAHIAQPARAEAPQVPLARGETSPLPRSDAAAERTAMLQRVPAAPMSLAAASAAANAQATAAGAAAAGTTMAAASATAPATALAQATEARNANPLMVADRGQNIARPDVAGTYTGEGPQRRSLRGSMRALPGGFSTLLATLGAQGHAGAAGRDPGAAERELRETMMQWLFWLLAIIAYGCVAFAVIGLMPAGSLGGIGMGSGGGSAAGRAWTGGFALAGLIAGAGAWWFARGIARGGHDRS